MNSGLKTERAGWDSDQQKKGEAKVWGWEVQAGLDRRQTTSCFEFWIHQNLAV